MELTEAGEHSFARRSGETDNQVLFLGAASDEATVLVEDVLQFIERREHLLVNIVGETLSLLPLATSDALSWSTFRSSGN